MAGKEVKRKSGNAWGERYPENGLRHIKVGKALSGQLHRCHPEGSRDTRTQLRTA